MSGRHALVSRTPHSGPDECRLRSTRIDRDGNKVRGAAVSGCRGILRELSLCF